MARYVREFDERAVHDLEGFSPARIVRRLSELEESPLPRGDTVKRLTGFAIPTCRFRVGDYRAIFRTVGTRVIILRVVHRGE